MIDNNLALQDLEDKVFEEDNQSTSNTLYQLDSIVILADSNLVLQEPVHKRICDILKQFLEPDMALRIMEEIIDSEILLTI